MRVIKLTRGLEAVVDDHWYDRLSQWNWCAIRTSPTRFYACLGRKRDGKTKIILMHRQILGIEDAPRSVEGDHRDGDSLNNQSSNLRIATHQKNMRNRGSHKGSSSKYRGVFFDRHAGVFKAKLTIGKGQQLYLGSSSDEAELAQRYDEAVRSLGCEFAQN